MHRKIESLIAFFAKTEFAALEKKRANGWYIVYLSESEGGYTFVLEKCSQYLAEGVYIPPRKKLKIG
jgi:hypothetical protein